MADTNQRDVIFNVKYQVDTAAMNALKASAVEITRLQNESGKAAVAAGDMAKKAADQVTAAQNAAADAYKRAIDAYNAANNPANSTPGAPGGGPAPSGQPGGAPGGQTPGQTPRPTDAGKEAADTLRKGLEASMALGKSYAALNIAMDKTIDANVRAFAVFTAGSEAAKAYAGFVDALNNTMSIASSLKGTAGAAGAGAAGAGAGAGGAAAGAAGIALLPVAAAGVALAAVFVAIAAVISGDFREGLMEIVGLSDRVGDAQKRLDASNKVLAAAQIRRGDELADNNRDRKLIANDYNAIQGDDAAANAGRMQVARRGVEEANQRAARASQRTGDPAGMAEAQRDQAAANELVKKTLEETRAIGLKSYQEQTAAAKALLDVRKQEYQTAVQMANTERQRLMTTEQKLAQLDPIEAAALKDAYGRANSGENISREDANRLRGLGLQDEAVQDADRRRVSELGLDPVLQEQRATLQRDSARQDKLSVDVQTQNEIVMKIAGDSSDFVKVMTDQIEAVARRIAAETRAAIEKEREAEKRANRQQTKNMGR